MNEHDPPAAPPPLRPEPGAGLTPSDQSQLRVLVILQYIYAGFTALGGCCGLIYVGLGAAAFVSPETFDSGNPSDPPPEALGWIFGVMGFVVVAICWTIAALIAYSAKSISQRRRRIYCIVVAALMCLSVPLGTALGVFTLIVLYRPTVMRAFEQQ